MMCDQPIARTNRITFLFEIDPVGDRGAVGLCIIHILAFPVRIRKIHSEETRPQDITPHRLLDRPDKPAVLAGRDHMGQGCRQSHDPGSPGIGNILNAEAGDRPVKETVLISIKRGLHLASL